MDTEVIFSFYATEAAMTRQVAEYGDEVTPARNKRGLEMLPYLPRTGDLIVEEMRTYRVTRVVFSIEDQVIYVDSVVID